MTVSSQGFVPERLRQAMRRRRKTAAALAAHLQVADNTVSRFLSGQLAPRPDALRLIASFLSEPVAFFLSPLPSNIDIGSPSFMRSYAAATKRARLSAEAFKERTREVTNYLELHVEFPAARFPSLRYGDDPAVLSGDDIEEAATETRRAWGLADGPIANMVRLLEHNGAIVARTDLGDPTLNAFSQWGEPENRPYVILSDGKHSKVGSRFDAAHELGHMVLHRHLPRSLVVQPEVHKLVERQANRFAGAFLLPADSFSRTVYLPTVSALRELQPMWGVTIGSMIMRLSELELISQRQARRLWEVYAPTRKRDTHEGNGMPLEVPSTLRQSFEIVREFGVSPSQVAVEIPFNSEDITAIGGLPLGYFRDDLPRVRPKQSSASVLEFRRTRQEGA